MEDEAYAIPKATPTFYRNPSPKVKKSCFFVFRKRKVMFNKKMLKKCFVKNVR